MAITHVAHPAPFSHVPKGKRNVRTDYALLRTPVELREAPASAFAPFAKVKDVLESYELHAHEGALWLRLTGANPAGRTLPFGRDRFLGFLEGRDPLRPAIGTDMARHFVRTPLLAVSDSGTSRGGDLDPAASRRVLLDGRAGAPARLRAFLERNVVLSGDHVFVRMRGPLARQGTGTGANHGRYQTEFFPASWRSYLYEPPAMPNPFAETQGYLVRPDRAGDLHAFLRGNGFAGYLSAAGPDLSRIAVDVPPALLDDSDIHLMAQFLPEMAVAEARRYVDLMAEYPGRKALQDRIEALRAAAAWGRLGGVMPEEAEGVLVQLRDLVDALAVASPELIAGNARLSFMRAWAAEFALPRLRAPDASPEAEEDARALSGLAM